MLGRTRPVAAETGSADYHQSTPARAGRLLSESGHGSRGLQARLIATDGSLQRERGRSATTSAQRLLESRWCQELSNPRSLSSPVCPTYRRSAAGARGSAATDKPVCCNALLGSHRLRLRTGAATVGGVLSREREADRVDEARRNREDGQHSVEHDKPNLMNADVRRCVHR